MQRNEQIESEVTECTIKQCATVCDCCGTTAEHIVNNQCLGCAECYSVFRNEITAQLTALGRGVKHMGRCYVKRDT